MNTEKVLKYGSYTVAFLIPWVTFGRWVFPHTTSKAFLLYGFMSILTALWVYLLCTDSRYRLSKREWVYVSPLLVYVLWMTIAGIAAHSPGLAFWGTLMRETGLLTLYAATMYALIIISLSKRYEGYIYKLLGWAVGGGAVVAASVWFGDEGFNTAINVLRKGSGGGVTGNSSLAGAYMIFLLGFTIFLLNAKQVVKKTRLWILGAFIIFSPLFINLYRMLSGKSMLGSARGAFLGIVIGTGVAVLVYLTAKKSTRILGIAGLAAGVIVGAIAWIQLVTPGTTLHQKFVDVASGTRFAFWEISQKAMNERPLVGYGPENFPIAQSRYFDPQFLSRDLAFEAWTDHPHNVYYDNGVAAGYPGIALYVLFIGSLIYITYRKSNFSSVQKSILIGTLLGYLVQNLVAFDGFITIFILMIYTGVVYGSAASSTAQAKAVITKKSWHLALAGMLVIAAIVGVYHLSYKPSHKAKLYASILGSKLDQRPLRYHEFGKGSPVGTYWDVSGFGYDEYKLYARDPVAVKQDQKILPYAIKDVDASIKYLEELAKTNKTDYRLYFTIVNLYNTKIYFSDLPYDPTLAAHMTELITYAQGLAPTDPRIHWLYAQLAAWKGDVNGVITAYQKGINIDPTLPVSHRLLLQFVRGVGNQKLYNEFLINAQKEIPGFVME